MSPSTATSVYSKGQGALLALLISIPGLAHAQDVAPAPTEPAPEPAPAPTEPAAPAPTPAAEGEGMGDWGVAAEADADADAPVVVTSENGASSAQANTALNPTRHDAPDRNEPDPQVVEQPEWLTPAPGQATTKTAGGQTLPLWPNSQMANKRYFTIERLPPAREVYPRGIPMGSMEMIWHGLQWPHYPVTGLPISGNIWVDSGYERSERSLASENDRAFWLQQGYFTLRASPTWSNGNLFVQAQAELLAWHSSVRGNQPIDVDDAWVKFGMWDKFDLQLGRFEAWEIYHKGMGFERNTLEDIGAFDESGGRDSTIVDIYEVNYAFYRSDGYGQAAVHYYPFKFLRFEVAGLLGNESGFNAIGVRPTGILDFGFIKLKVGGEYKKESDWETNQKREAESRGMGASLQFVYSSYVEGGINGAYGIIDRIGPDGRVDEKGSPTTASVGAFVNARPWRDLVLGAGANYTDQDNRQYNSQVDDVGHFTHRQFFGAIQHSIFIPELTAKVVLAYAKARMDESFDNDKTNEMMSARLRVRYVF
jgi:hypothetical protein